MARIVTTTPKNQKRLLLKAGLSIFLFLQIQMPNIATGTLKKLNHWSFELCRQSGKVCCSEAHNNAEAIAFVAPAEK